MEWFQAVEKIAPYVVKIETPRGHGTGFLCMYNANQDLCGIATAYHVVCEADDWQEPMRLVHDGTPSPAFLTEASRVIFSNPANDSAVILFPARQLNLPKQLISLIPAGQFGKVGVEVGWLGYPALAPKNLCFFTGAISTYSAGAYFIDGVAINGVSGGPVFYRHGNDIFILGTISAYYPNIRSTGDSLPGLSFAQGVSHFYDIINQVRSMDEAREAQKEQEAAQAASAPEDGSKPPEAPRLEPPRSKPPIKASAKAARK